jgi:hypothetical protein
MIKNKNSPVPFVVGNLQAVMLCDTAHVACAFDPDQIARFKLPKIKE